MRFRNLPPYFASFLYPQEETKHVLTNKQILLNLMKGIPSMDDEVAEMTDHMSEMQKKDYSLRKGDGTEPNEEELYLKFLKFKANKFYDTNK